MRPLHTIVMGATALALLAAGCGGAIPSSNGGPAAVQLMRSQDGSFLADTQGRSLYLFEKDEDGESYCTGACAAVWPPLETNARPRGAAGVSAAALGTITREDGDTQVTYHGHPLYYYAGDASTTGKTRGEDREQFGAGWYLVDAGGKALEPESGSGSKPNSGSNRGGGGYR
jgi:predicted lipoprotein with Yx(FWY)xxD motif